MSATRFQFDLTPAYTAFLETIAAAQRCRETPQEMQAVLDVIQGRLDHQWQTLTQLATANLEEPARAALDVLLRQWAVKEALELLLRKYGTFIDPLDQGLCNRFWQVLAQQHQALSSELMLSWEQGRQAQEQARVTQPKNWEEFAYRMLQQQHGQQRDWQGTAYQLLQEQRTAWQASQQVAQQWGEVARRSTEQQQYGAQRMYDFVEATQSHVVGMHEAFQHHLEQRLPEEIREAAREESSRRRNARLIIVLIMLGVSVLLLWLSYFLITHLY